MLEDGSFRDIEHAELAAELGTIELVGGADKQSRKLFDRSLDAPTGNSLAQAEWASRRLPSLVDRVARTNAPFDAEARAQRAAQAGDWETAIASARGWQSDQPFDERAAVVGSYIASVGLEEWEAAFHFADVGLRATPGQPLLLNNKAFALINLGKLEEAAKVLAQAPYADTGDGAGVTLPATRGLLAFRQGDPDRGRALYLEAVEIARRHGDTDAEAMAIAMLLRTEAYAGDRRDLTDLIPVLRTLAGLVKDRGAAECVAKAVEVSRDWAP
jgi:tetratricopeptide (TPR) repeat protein